MSEVILKKDGRIVVRGTEIVTQDEYEVDLNPALLATLGRGILLKIKDAAQLPLGSVGVCVLGDGTVYLSIRLPQLKLKTAATIDGEKAWPVFSSAGTAIEFLWVPPDDCAVIYLAQMVPTSPGWACKQPYLFAQDLTKPADFYHLPLANLYSDCRLCTGLDRPTAGSNALDCLAAALNHLEASRWNSHLIGDNGDVDNAKAVFQFKVVKDGFETLTNPKWKSYSRKVGTTLLEYIAL